MDDSIINRVVNGAVWLDRVNPGWAESINLDTLDMEATSHCVLGQLYSVPSTNPYDSLGFWRVMCGKVPALGNECYDWGWMRRHGFAGHSGHGFDEVELSALHQAWRDMVTARLA